MHSLVIALVFLAIIVVASSIRHNNQRETEKSQLRQELSDYFFEESNFPSVIFDPDLKIALANKSFRAIFMSSPHSAPQPISMAGIAKLWQNEICRNLLTTLKTTHTAPTEPLLFNLKFENASGELETHIIVFKNYGNCPGLGHFLTFTAVNAIYATNVAEDLAIKIAEKDDNLKKLEDIDRLKSEFLATLSHELKTPLVSIIGYLDLIASEKMGPLTDKQSKALQISLKNTTHLNTLISSILNFARMEAGKLMFDLVHQKLPPRINETVDSMRPIAENRNITLQTSFADNLPAVVIDPELMHRVMCNLIENAIKFSPEGNSVNIAVSLHSSQLVKVKVSDYGCGIPADKLEKIKTPFYQVVKSDTRPTSGLGLGLAICEKILVGHGTSLEIESHENQGTICTFYLKAAS
ncbi:MAG: HAMP domain-containing histidine kinase [Candidatus Riflebacteria bacterium]|nr:HAMP domain-containing histidine kinase [Candidatus Riflebacteria bacterium]